MTWGELKAAFTALLDREDATTAQIEAWCQDGYARVGRVLRIPTMERRVELEVHADGYLTIPSDFLRLKKMWTAEAGKIRKATYETMLTWAALAGYPEWYARVGSRWYIWPTPGAGTTVNCIYLGAIAPIVDDNSTDPILTLAAPLVIRAALVFAEDFFDGSRQAKWEAQYQQILAELHEQAAEVDLGEQDTAVEAGYPDLEY